MRDGFIFYESFRKAMKGLPAETQLLLYNAIADYALYDEEPDFGDDGIALGFFTLIRPQLDANIRKRENGARGGRPGKALESEPCENQTGTEAEPCGAFLETAEEPNDNQSETTAKPSDNLGETKAEPNAKEKAKAKANGNAKEKENAKALCADKPRRFTKPTVEEIQAYCKERGNDVEPQRFFDFYEAKGWKVGTSPMKDWKAAIRTWEGRDRQSGRPPGKRSVKHDYPQHTFTEEQLARLYVNLDDPVPGAEEETE